MKRTVKSSLFLAVVGAALWALAPRGSADEPVKTRPVTIGMAQTIFVDIPRPLVNIVALPFGHLMKEQTGVDGKLIIAGDAYYVGERLNDNRYQLGIFQGIEFAWARSKYPDLQPLMIAVSKHRTLHANLVTVQDNQGINFAAFRGKDVALPQRSKEHLRLFLERGCTECGQKDPQAFFGQVVRPRSTEDALDEVCSGTIAAAVIDTLDLESYRDIKPGCFKRLKVVQQSDPFPTGVIAFRKGAVDQATLDKFRTGMVNAHNNLKARELMALFQLTAFEQVPANFDVIVANILRAYPPPEPAPAKSASKR